MIFHPFHFATRALLLSTITSTDVCILHDFIASCSLSRRKVVDVRLISGVKMLMIHSSSNRHSLVRVHIFCVGSAAHLDWGARGAPLTQSSGVHGEGMCCCSESEMLSTPWILRAGRLGFLRPYQLSPSKSLPTPTSLIFLKTEITPIAQAGSQLAEVGY